MQISVIDFARSVLGLEKPNSSKFDARTLDHVVIFMPEGRSAKMARQRGCIIRKPAGQTSSLGSTARMVWHPLVEHSSFRSFVYSNIHFTTTSFVPSISVLLALVFVGICSGMAISALLEGKTNTPKLIPQLDNRASFFNLFASSPVTVTTFTFHFNVHIIGGALREASDMTSVVRISLVLCSGIYFTIGIFGYLLFGDSIMADILVNFDQGCQKLKLPL
ncbi:amino acid transporter AVT6C-like isoform X5 [Apium graveolens]|uniref:amino acid transporter AVT6C-like isoform X5 n=1 Tax=Apium graveolens TaxID=4045 RepID=UPI003D7B5846